MAGPEPLPPSGRRFVLLRALGEGAYGEVYLAEMESTGGFRRRVALKLLKPDWSPDSDAARRFRDEARLLGRLQHRHIVRVDDLVRLGDRWALVMEYIDGADLERIFGACLARERTLSARMVADIGAAVAAALQAATETPGEDGAPLGAVHRDIKPSNVRLSTTGEVKVLDFGVARAAFVGRESRTDSLRYGSLGYMAPERLLGADDSPAGDVYGLGVVLYELLTLRTFGRAEVTRDRQAAQVDAARQAIAGHAPGLGDLVARMLDFDPSARISAAELVPALTTLGASLPGESVAAFAGGSLAELLPPDLSDDPARGRSFTEHTAGEQETVRSATLVFPVADGLPAAPPLSPPREPERAPRVSRAPLVGVGLLLLAVAGAIGFGVGRPGDARPSPPAAPPLPAAGAPEATAPSAPVAAEPAQVTVSPPEPGVPDPREAAPARPSVAARPSPRVAAVRAAAAPGAAPSSAAAPSSEAATPIAAATAPVVTAPPVADAAPLRAVKFTLTGGEGLEVRCGSVSAQGTTNALLRDVPAGDCIVTSGGHRAVARVDAPRGVACTLDGEVLTCR